MVGFVIPSCKESGFPSTGLYKVTSFKEMERAFREENVANNAYVYMAQPLVTNAPAFCLTVFGSDNRFTNNHVESRWNYLEKELKLQDIEIEGFSSDGDSR